MKRHDYVDIVCFLLVVILSILLTFDLSGAGAGAPKQGALSIPGSQLAFLDKEYDSASAEIRMRIDEENSLFLQKFIFVGAILAFLFHQSLHDVSVIFDRGQKSAQRRLVLACCWAAVVVAALIDIRLEFNTVIIQDLGFWIRSMESVRISTVGVYGWETFYGSASIRWKPPMEYFVFIDRQLLTSVLFAVILYISLQRHHRRVPSSGLVLMAWPCAISCFMLFGLPCVYAGSVNLWRLAIACLGIVTLVIWYFVSRSFNRRCVSA